MRWTRTVRQTSAVNADGEVVWSWHPDADAKFAGVTNAADDGGKKARSPGRVRRTPLKPLRREGRMFRRTCGDLLVCFFIFAREAMGANRAPGFPCALCFLGGMIP